MDRIDQQLIAILRQDGRRAIADLAADIGASRATVRNHLNRLEDRGVIRGYTVQLNTDFDDYPVRAVMMIEIKGKPCPKIVKQLMGVPQVLAVHSTNGRWDYIVELGADNLSEFDDTIQAIRLFESVSLTETSLQLTTYKQVR
ncbi:Lrp/AsnC family transcriptional regulator [Saccharospirillum salsuginis]|uniref:AsnC family transcriptional regulator n=1 Tax=Saccharospirillum salsuginis TaxID=418750 RepID=A0A918KEU9_9GAMM|nr:Lrp/AsnC family transcriptional regulator [Saccharospirillum salsuginis]GGX60939.1 AsnC family transcriptional regulator [Saccharospirillum salsuginis]